MLSVMQHHDGSPAQPSRPSQPSRLSRLRRGHEELVLDLLRKHGPLTRSALGTYSGLSRTTLYDIIAALLSGGAVVSVAPDPALRKRGRPVETLALNPEAGQALGIDFARRAVHVAAANVAHEIIGSASEPHAADLSWEDRVGIAERLVSTLAGGTLRLGALSAIGVGVVGPVDAPGDARGDAPGDARGDAPGDARGDAPGDAPGDEPPRTGPADVLPALLGKRFGVRTLLDNNTRLAALAETVWGAAAGEQDVIYLRLSHGVGGGLVVGGALHRGPYGLSGELGHITVEADGARCQCGGTGCLETVASVGAVLDAYRAAGGEARDTTALVAALESGDTVARRLMDRVGTHVGTVVAAACNVIGPGVIVIGGELTAAGPALTTPVEQALGSHIMAGARHRVDLRRAALGEAGAALGGIALVLHESPLLSRYPARPDPEETP
ncbi:ROK family protein [Streptomyces lycii]|uniref:ROK family protein n=2 Tax=Streptomyces lycii TaxID=2654337 RepID=A0ABQ7FFD9_9ACTN|nr:ROK family protein [Streptomyces lycii]